MKSQHTTQTKTSEHDRSSQATTKPSAAPAVHPMLHLQRQVGNQAVGRLIQAKLTVGEPNDVYEQEADLNSTIKYPPANGTGLPDNLKLGIESLSGISMNDVEVHYNSSSPFEIEALAYTQGTDIYMASGQEKYLAHEAWHVVQQKQGRVAPMLQTNGVAINNDPDLEKEATIMGAKALSIQPAKIIMEQNKDKTVADQPLNHLSISIASQSNVMQCMNKEEDDDGFIFNAKKKKPSEDEKKEKEKNTKEKALGIAKYYLKKLKPVRSESTLCIFLDASGIPLYSGESGWDKKPYKKQIGKYLDTMYVEEKNQLNGYGGIQCAEPEAILHACQDDKIHNVKYSLAYDQKSKSYKCACGSCGKYFQKYNIIDLLS